MRNVEQIELSILHKDKTISKGTVTTGFIPMSEGSNIDDSRYYLSFSHPKLEDFSCEEDDLFGALTNLRKHLERNKTQALCNGSRENIVVSGMSRSMGGGVLGCLVEYGKQSSDDELVNIFDYAPPNEIVTVKVQEKFTRKWCSFFENGRGN
jgi:hypothetical protein